MGRVVLGDDAEGTGEEEEEEEVGAAEGAGAVEEDVRHSTLGSPVSTWYLSSLALI